MAVNLENQKEILSSAEDVEPQKALLFRKFVEKADQSISEVEDFLIKITSILTSKPLRFDIIKVDNFFKVWLCLISQRMTKENSLIFKDGTCFTRQQLELIYGIDFVNALIQFLLSLKTFSRVELKLFVTVAVLSRVVSNFFWSGYIFEIYDDDNAAKKLKEFCAGFFDCDISQKLLKLSELVEQHNDAIAWVRLNLWPKHNTSIKINARLRIPLPAIKPRCPVNLEGPPSAELEELRKTVLWKEWSEELNLQLMPIKYNGNVCLTSLSAYDQECLLKHGSIEIWFCSVSPDITRNALVSWPTGFTREELERMFGPDFVDAFTETLLSLQAYQLSTLEMKLFQDIVLLSQRPGLEDAAAVQKLQDCAIEKFKAERLKNQKNTNDVDIPQMLSKLQALSLLHSNSLDWLIENSDKLRLPTAFCELMDIPNFIFNV